MKVLLTGATGFVGSHVLDRLRARRIATVIFLRKTSNTRFIKPHLNSIELRYGELTNPESIYNALDGITHVVHCAGLTKAVRSTDFYTVNHVGTRNVVEAINRRVGQVKRLVHVSSLGAIGPATPGKPAREDDPPRPVSHYGKSKLAAELEVKQNCKIEFVILRPTAVYGPRDDGFLPLFRAVNRHTCPVLLGGIRELNLVFVHDLAEAIVTCLNHPAASGKAYFLANPEIAYPSQLAREIAKHLGIWTVPVPLPVPLLLPIFTVNHAVARLTGKPTLLTVQKYAELRAQAWTCDTTRAETELGITCKTTLQTGIPQTIDWYRQQRWL